MRSHALQGDTSRVYWERAKKEVEEAENLARQAEQRVQEATRLAEAAAKAEEAANAAAREEVRLLNRKFLKSLSPKGAEALKALKPSQRRRPRPRRPRMLPPTKMCGAKTLNT